jgi:rhodanese-related sulfurtransferase
MSSPQTESRLPATLRATPLAPDAAREHFLTRRATAVDPDDLAADLVAGAPGIVVVDARGRDAFAAARIVGAVNLPYDEPDAVSALPPEVRVAVVYGAGPSCDAGLRVAARLADRGLPVKELLGGFEYWLRGAHPVTGAAPR